VSNVNCKEIKDVKCESCNEKKMCRTYLGLKTLDEYDDTEPVRYIKKPDYTPNTPIIVKYRRNPILGIEWECNIAKDTLPDRIRNMIEMYRRIYAKDRLRSDVDYKGVVKTFE